MGPAKLGKATLPRQFWKGHRRAEVGQDPARSMFMLVEELRVSRRARNVTTGKLAEVLGVSRPPLLW